MRVPTMLTEIDELPAIQLGDYTLQLELGPLSEFGREVAERELRETPDVQEKAVRELKAMMKEQEPDIVLPEFDEYYIRYLRRCKYYPESAKELIKRYFDFKVQHANVYDDLLPSAETNIFNQNILTVMPNRDQLGRRILLIELGKSWKHKECGLNEVFKGNVLFSEAALLEPETQVHGVVVIFDMNGLSLAQTMQFTPQFAKLIVDWLQDVIPLRVKAIHIINQPKIFNIVFTLFKRFLREKLKDRIYFHGTDRESLFKHISSKCLPPLYGGSIDIPRVNGSDWLQLLVKCDDEYRAINELGYPKEMRNKKNKKK